MESLQKIFIESKDIIFNKFKCDAEIQIKRD